MFKSAFYWPDRKSDSRSRAGQEAFSFVVKKAEQASKESSMHVCDGWNKLYKVFLGMPIATSMNESISLF